jgi:hypothetical protein
MMAPASILTGWNGASTAIRVRVDDAGALDAMEFYDSTNTTPLNLLGSGTTLALNADYVSQATLFNATIVRSGSDVTVTIGSLVSGAVQTNVNTKATLTWTPSSAATDTTGKRLYPAAVSESGMSDRDF